MERFTAQDTNGPLFHSTGNMAHPHRLCEREEREREEGRGEKEPERSKTPQEHGPQNQVGSEIREPLSLT